MTEKFADALFTELMAEHASALDGIALPPPARARRAGRPLLLTAAAFALLAATTAGAMLTGGSGTADAVTVNSDGTVVISVKDGHGIDAASREVHRLGLSSLAVLEARPGCPSFFTLPPDRSGRRADDVTMRQAGPDKLRVDVRNIPPGDTALILYQTMPGGQLVSTVLLINGPAPACVSFPPLKVPEPQDDGGTGSGSSQRPGG
ncbi:hypothetical protein [Kitasatospora viridis]|uniref:Uncharacterized protein n=1 Tax=Kitasatospora viridis TaxID=281105 RepID=A0A561T6X3_9ACTN|nr:hypothetical protein [Kitasatospora viridis]TWF82863.1 hypothetical protein FHX73_14345 [Kitasatospora viridis]